MKVKINISKKFEDIIDDNVFEYLNSKEIFGVFDERDDVYILDKMGYNVPKEWCTIVDDTDDEKNTHQKELDKIIKELDLLVDKLNSIEGKTFENKCKISELDNKIEAVLRTK